jgi:hypothetical protein
MAWPHPTEEAGTENALAEVQIPDLEPTGYPIGEISRGTLQSVVKKLDEKVRATLESASARVVEDTRVRLRNELSAALQTFLAEASTRLHALEKEHLTRSKDELQTESTEQLKAQISDLQAVLSKPCLELKTLAAEADAAVSSMAVAVDTASKKLQAAEKDVEVRFSGATDEMSKVADNLVQSSASRLEKQADEATARLSENLRTLQARFVEETESHIAAIRQRLTESLILEAERIAQQSLAQTSKVPDGPPDPGLPESSVPAAGIPDRQIDDITSEPGPGQSASKKLEQVEAAAVPLSMLLETPRVAPPGPPESNPLQPDPAENAAINETVIKETGPQKPYREIFGEIAVARASGSHPALGTSPESRWRPAIIRACVVVLLISIFAASYYYFNGRHDARKSAARGNPPTAVARPSPETAPSPAERVSPASPPAVGSPSGKVASAPVPILPPTRLTNTPKAASISPEDSEDEDPVPVGKGDLTVTSDVPGARISLDGHIDRSWVTPHTFHDLPERFYVLAVSKDGYESDIHSVKVGPGSGVSFSARLHPSTGEITISTNPPGLDVFIDDKPHGQSPARAVLPVGQHTYRVVPPPGKAPLSRVFTIKSGGAIVKHTVTW